MVGDRREKERYDAGIDVLTVKNKKRYDGGIDVLTVLGHVSDRSCFRI